MAKTNRSILVGLDKDIGFIKETLTELKPIIGENHDRAIKNSTNLKIILTISLTLIGIIIKYGG